MGVHGDKTVVGGKTSTLNSSPNNKKKNFNATEISSNLKSNSKKASPTAAAGGQRANASSTNDAKMAPALTEPLSPTEKLSVPASVSPTAAAIGTESEECKTEATTTTASPALTPTPTASSSSSSLRASPANREKRNTTRSTVTASTRITRSKDNATAALASSAQERANTPSAAVRDSPTATVTSLRKSKRNSKEQDNEQMGVSAATPSAAATTTGSPTPTTTNSLTVTTSTASCEIAASGSGNNNNNNNIVCKDSSTAQLLADLTTDFEETITAEICLRKQLPEVKVTTPDAAQLSASSETESETTASKSVVEGCESPDIGNSVKPMEIAATENATGSNIDKNVNPQTPSKTEKQVAQAAKIQNVKHIAAASVVAAENTNVTADQSNADLLSSATIVDLPPVNSDSTMTASEEEPEELDALEAKLSQLDGTAVENTISEFANEANTAGTPGNFAATSLAATVATQVQSSPQQQATLQPQPQQQILPQTAMMSGSTPTQQLLLTPTGSSSSSQHMLALTPQSTSSLLREVNVAGAPSGGGELEDQELEEVLKALKGFDANAAGAEGVLCDLNVLLNEVYTTFNCDEMAAATNSGNAASGGQIQHQSQQQQQHHTQTNLLASTSTAAAITKLSTTSPLKELHVDIEKKQQLMQRKIDIILRRLRKLQVRYMSKHTTEEIAGLFELAARITHKGTGATNDVSAHSAKDLLPASVISARPPPRSWEEDLKTAISTTEMLNLLERLEKSANSQQICTAITSNSSASPTYASPTISSTQQMRKTKKLSELTSSTMSTTTSATTITATTDSDAQRSDDCVIPTLNPQIVDELTHVTGMLRAEMRDIQVAYDSDATESSSGGESADEMVAYNNQVQQSLSIVKRAAWRYSRERAAIASRWSWLLSQIADLEIKIRQHSELLQEVVRTKGGVVCEEDLARSSTASREQPLINAYGENEEVILSGACRTRGFLPSQFRKRKMLQTTSLHTISKKAARPSTIKCGCQCPLNPCALCTGRADPTAPRDLPDTMMFPERVALLDPGFHPVLSFTDNVSNSIHFEAIARTPNWQNRIVRIQPKSVVRSVWKAEREAANLSSHHSSRKFGDIMMPTQKRRYIRRKERNTTQASVSANTSVGSGGVGSKSTDYDTTTDFAMPAASTPPTYKSAAATVAGVGKFETSTPTAGSTLTAGAAAMATGNGTATLFGSTTPTTTPLVANKTTSKNVPSSKRMHCLLVGDGVLLEPISPNNNTSNQSNSSCQQTPQNCEPYNPSQTPSSLISNSQQIKHNTSNNKRRHYKQRKSVVSLQQQFNNNSNNTHINHTQHLQQQQQQYSYHHNNTHSQTNNSNGDINFDYWDTAGGGRSRTASPTHGIIGGSSSNYHKYERSLERRNRISYDIDNIVIPYSVAAATRVEILPYKEIPTPKWRVFDNELAFDQEQEEETSVEHLVPGENSTSQNEQQQIETTATPTKTVIKNLQETKIAAMNHIVVADVNDDDQKFAKPAEAIKLDKNLEKHTNESESRKLITSLKAQICDKIQEKNCAVAPAAAACNVVSVDNGSIDDANEHLPPPAKKAKVNEDVTTNSENAITANSMCDKDTNEIVLASDLSEDITDESFNYRHERALHEERRKFQTYLKFPWSTRSRANRRIDSRAESSGANTPDPASPAPNTPSVGGGDQESIPSPLAPSTPLTPLDAVNEAPESGSVTNASSTAHSSTTAALPPVFPLNVAAILSNYNSGSSKRNERRRTTSTRTQNSTERNERRSLTPDSREVPTFAIPSFEPLKFPLTQEAYEMLSSVTYLPPSVSSFFADNGEFGKQQHEFEQQHNNSSNSIVAGVGNHVVVGGHFRTATNRYGRRTTFTSKSHGLGNYELNGKKRRPYRRQQSILDAEHKVADSNDDDIMMKTATTSFMNGRIHAAAAGAVSGGAAGEVGGSGGSSITNANFTAHSTDVDDDYDEDEDDDDIFEEMCEDDDDDGYPKHPLAPGMNIDNLIGNDDDDDDYDSYGVTGITGSGVSDSAKKRRKHSHHRLGLSDSEFSEPDPFEDDDPNDPEWKGESSTKAERHSERLRKRSFF